MSHVDAAVVGTQHMVTTTARTASAESSRRAQDTRQGLGIGDLGQAGGGSHPVRTSALSVPDHQVPVPALESGSVGVFALVLGQVTAQTG